MLVPKITLQSLAINKKSNYASNIIAGLLSWVNAGILQFKGLQAQQCNQAATCVHKEHQ